MGYMRQDAAVNAEKRIRIHRIYTDFRAAKGDVMQPTKVLFLDIDGVLNSSRSCYAFDGFPHGFDAKNMAKFDHVAVALIRRLCEETGASICLSSSWRIIHSVHECANGLGLPIFDRTPSLNGTRGKEIAAWLADHQKVSKYAIVDDDSDMLPEQKRYFVKTNHYDGLRMAHYSKLKRILGEVPTNSPNRAVVS
jgi:hypothetical protein